MRFEAVSGIMGKINKMRLIPFHTSLALLIVGTATIMLGSESIDSSKCGPKLGTTFDECEVLITEW